MTRLAYVPLLVLWPSWTATLCAQVTGTVKSVAGQPIEEAFVRDLTGPTGRRVPLQTTPSGSFYIPQSAPRSKSGRFVLFFSHVGYMPTIRIVEPPAGDLEVTLRPLDATAWKLPDCSRPQRSPAFHIPEIKLRPSRGVRVARYKDIDFQGFAVTYVGQDRTYRLEGMVGHNASHGIPSPSWADGLSEITAGSAFCREIAAIDLRGITPDGRYSRWLGYFYSFIEYSMVSREAAAFFDKLIEQACCQ